MRDPMAGVKVIGPHGEEADRGGYDMTAFWCRASTAASPTFAEHTDEGLEALGYDCDRIIELKVDGVVT